MLLFFLGFWPYYRPRDWKRLFCCRPFYRGFTEDVPLTETSRNMIQGLGASDEGPRTCLTKKGLIPPISPRRLLFRPSSAKGQTWTVQP